MSFNETLKTRILGGAQNVRLGDFMTPSGGGGNATPDYVGSSGLEYLGQGLEAFGKGIGKVGDLIKDAKKQQQQEEQNKAESDMYLDVYNIQRTPSDMMTASQKEIAIDNVVNKYSGIVPVSKIHSILNANGAEPEKTYTRMSEQAAKQQSVQKQVDQNEELSKLATTMDPSYMSASFSSQISAGRTINRNISLFSAAMDKAISLGPNVSDEQSIADRNGTFDEAAQWARGLFPKDARTKYYNNQWTEKDTADYINGFARSLTQKINPITGTVLSKQEADFYAREVASRMFGQMDKIKLDSTKHTLEYQNAVLDIMANDLGMASESNEQVALYVMTRKSPDMLAQVFGTDEMKKNLAANMSKIGMTSNGHVLFPRGLSNQFISLMADNSEMPLQQADSVKELFLRHDRQQPTLNGNRNSLELIDSRQDNWLATLPTDYAKENIDIMKQALPKDISLGIQSLVQARMAPQPNEGWFQRAVRWINNEAVDQGTYTSPEDMLKVRGANAEAINSMLNQYVDSLERIGMPEKDINDIISNSIQMAGIPKGEGNSRSLIRMAVNSIANGLTEPLRKANPVAALGDAVTKVAETVATQEEVKEPELDTIKEQPKEVEVGDGKVDVSSIYDTKAYKTFVKNLVKEVKEGRMTEDQAKNEVSVFLSKIGDAFSAVFGVKTAQAEELPIESLTKDKRPIETSSDLSVEKLGKSVKNNNIFNTRGKNKAKGFAKFKTQEDSIKEAELDAATKLERFGGDVMKLCEQYAPRADNNLTSRYCAGLLYRTPGVSDADKQTLQAVVNDILQYKDKKDQLKADKANEGIIRHIASKYTDLFYKDGKVVTVRPILIWQAKMETGTDLK